MTAFDGFLTDREVARMTLPRQRGTIIFTSATALLRDHTHFTTFSDAKFVLCALAQSVARELRPKGIHIAHPTINGAIDTDFIRETLPELYEREGRDGILDPEHTAEAY